MAGSKFMAFIRTIMPLAMPLIMIGASKFIDAENPLHKQICLWSYIVSTVLTLGVLLFIRIRITQANDEKILEIEVKPDPWDADAVAAEEERKKNLKPGQKPQKPPKRKITVKDYDLEKWSSHMTQKFLLPAGITVFMFRQFGYVVPLLLQAVMGPQQHWGWELLQIHLLGKKATGDLERPFAEPSPMEEMAKRFGVDSKKKK
jgi:hypothetical protein